MSSPSSPPTNEDRNRDQACACLDASGLLHFLVGSTLTRALGSVETAIRIAREEGRAEAQSKRDVTHVERILCAAIYVDDGKDEPPRRSYTYPTTGLVFSGWRHSDCFTALTAWADRLTQTERAILEEQLHGRNQGFLTSRGRFVGRDEAGRVAFLAGQVDRDNLCLVSEDLY